MVSRIAGLFKRNDMDPECAEVRESSSDFIDEDLDEAVAKKISDHLSRCGPCNSFIQTLKATVNLLRSTPQERAPKDFAERLKKRIEED